LWNDLIVMVLVLAMFGAERRGWRTRD